MITERKGSDCGTLQRQSTATGFTDRGRRQQPANGGRGSGQVRLAQAGVVNGVKVAHAIETFVEVRATTRRLLHPTS